MTQNYETTNESTPNPRAEQWAALSATESQKDALEDAEKQAKEVAVQEVGSQLHDVWREPRKQADGSYEPREKTTADKVWIEKHGTDTVDIANTDFKDLPQDWKQENEDAARVLVDLMRDSYGFDWSVKDEDGKHTDEARHMASEVHERWLGRENNAWPKGGGLDVLFEKLPSEEQNKDLAQVELINKLVHADTEPAYVIHGVDSDDTYNKYGRLLERKVHDDLERF